MTAIAEDHPLAVHDARPRQWMGDEARRRASAEWAMHWTPDVPVARCWADARRPSGRLDECRQIATTALGLCTSHYRWIVGR
jgi:hypothetical protein